MTNGRLRVRSLIVGVIIAAWISVFVVLPIRAQEQTPEASGTPVSDANQAAGADKGKQDQTQDQDKDRQNSAPPAQNPKKKDDRIFGIMPNYATVEGATDITPLTRRQKFKITAQGVFDPYEFVIVGVLAGVNQAEDEDKSLGQGAAGFGLRYGIGFADQAVGNFMTGAIFPSILRQDPRYFQLGKGGFRHRFVYAFSRIIITRQDSGGRAFNYSEVLGNAVAGGLSNLYSADEDRNISNTANTFGEQILIDSLGNELKEFWPDIRRHVFQPLRSHL